MKISAVTVLIEYRNNITYCKQTIYETSQIVYTRQAHYTTQQITHMLLFTIATCFCIFIILILRSYIHLIASSAFKHRGMRINFPKSDSQVFLFVVDYIAMESL